MDATAHSPILVNALGHLAGVIAFAAFLLLVDRGARLGGRARLSAPAGAAALALLWNLGSLIVLVSDPAAPSRDIIASISFAVLSLLPGVLLHLALGAQYRWLRIAGYLTSLVAASLHIMEGLGIAIGSHELAVDLITFGFGSLAAVFVLLLLLRRADKRRAAARASVATSLFLLAGSFIHFEADPGPASWTHELIFHHAAIPLALFVLLQDHRFLLLDAFARWLGAVILAGAFSGTLAAVFWNEGWLRLEETGPVGLAVLVSAMSLAILAYPRVRDFVGRRVEPILFPRGDLNAAIQRLHAIGDDVESFPQEAAQAMAEFAGSERWSLSSATEQTPGHRVEALAERDGENSPGAQLWAEVAVNLRVAPGQIRTLWLGPRTGGRRFLGADLRALDRLAEESAIRLETLRRDEQQRLLAEAELQALRAQINPHFLFNALNALYGGIPRNAPAARRTLLNLADILRYSLDSKRQYVALEDELRVVEAYLAIERLRLQDRLSVRITCDDAARAAKIPAFTVQPLVENSVKHGISGKEMGGEVVLDLRISDGRISVVVEDNGVGFDPGSGASPGHGLYNVQRRLELCYGKEAEISVASFPTGTRVQFSVPLAAEQGNADAAVYAASTE